MVGVDRPFAERAPVIALVQQAVDTGLRESFKLADVPAAWIVVLVIAPLGFLVCVLG